MRRPTPLLLWLGLGPACAGVGARLPPPGRASETGLRAAVVESARSRLGQQKLSLHGRLLPADCLALPRAALGDHGLDLGPGTAAALFSRLAREGRLRQRGAPRPGDLVFLRSASAAPGAPAQLHIGLIGEVDADGTLLVYQRLARGVGAYRMNPSHPHQNRAGPHRPVWNDSLGWSDHPGDGASEQLPAGASFSGYASVLP